MLNKLQNYVLERISHYENLNIAGQKVVAPYHINHVGNIVVKGLLKKAEVPEEYAKKVHDLYKARGVNWGWYRGKGTPEELESAALEISKGIGYSLNGASAEGIQQFMRLYGLGIECSGFVFNVLYYAFENLGKKKVFLDSLAWSNPENPLVNYAGAFVFAEDASKPVKLEEIRSLDLILFKNASGSYNHIALLVKKEEGLCVVQAAVGCIPDGINLSNLEVSEDGNVVFGYKPQIGSSWEELYSKGLLEFRRLNVLDALD